MTQQTSATPGINRITVRGFKSIVDEQSIEIKPLTILAGANSSGKSSIMQPLLLMKQTLESPYEPGVFKLDGPNVFFTEYGQFFSSSLRKLQDDRMMVSFDFSDCKQSNIYRLEDEEPCFESMELAVSGKKVWAHELAGDRCEIHATGFDTHALVVPCRKERLFFVVDREGAHSGKGRGVLKEVERASSTLKQELLDTVHVPGGRGTPERELKVSSKSKPFMGVFTNNYPSVLSSLSRKNGQASLLEDNGNDKDILSEIDEHLKRLNLAGAVKVKQVSAVQIEVEVKRLKYPRNAETRYDNIADVGFGVSQVLPVVSALAIAKPNQLVYIEEPELHLHPKAQWELAAIMAETANRGVRLVIETHSDIILRGIQTLVARGELSSDKVALHWFSLDEEGKTRVSSAELDENGAYGDWPEDFDETALMVEGKYYEAVEKRLFSDG